ncbi:hypothetical protein [Ochrobactrum sp. Kaboul]
MSVRSFTGMLNGRMLKRMTAPGYDANNLADPATFSSDNDYLKLHTIVDIPLTKYQHDGKRYYIGEAAFPDLGYLPLIFVSITPTSLGRVFFPNDRATATQEMNDFFQIAYWTNHIWVSTEKGVDTSYDYRFRALVFKNRLQENF